MEVLGIPRCFECFNRIDKPKLLFRDEDSSEFPEVNVRNDVVTQRGIFNRIPVTIVFCNQGCKSANKDGFKKLSKHVEELESEIHNMEQNLSNELFPPDFKYHDMEGHAYCHYGTSGKRFNCKDIFNYPE